MSDQVEQDHTPSENEIDLQIGRRLRRRRRLLGLTQHELGDGLGLHGQQIHRYECAANRISAARLHRIASVLKAPVQYFYEGVPSENGPAADDRYEILSNDETLALVHACLKLPTAVRRRLFDFAAALGAEC